MAELLLAAHEVATNSVRHGGGGGTVRIWDAGPSIVCEVSDRGRLEDPLAGRWLPAEGSETGRGLWLANHFCDLVQLRSGEDGTVVRLHMTRP